MIANLLILAFILGMAYVWSVYGLFSAFLQLIVVIAAGSIALAVWEPLAVGFLMGRMPVLAWGVGLLGPFVLALILLRTVCDVVVRQNVHFPRLVSALGGGACGLLSGILIAGLAWIGISFLPMSASIGGVQNYRLAFNGEVEEASSGRLWLAVDKIAAGFFGGLSNGAFGTSQPLALYQPDLAWQAGVYRLHKDPHASAVARPTGVEVTAAHAQPTPLPGIDSAVAEAFGPAAAQNANQLVIVDTLWKRDPGTFDSDSALRLAPSQVRLVIFEGPDRDPRPRLIAPRGCSRLVNFDTGERSFHPLTSDQTDVRTNQQSETIGFVFLVPADAQPRHMLLRHLRVELPAIQREIEPFKQALGQPLPPVTPDADGSVSDSGSAPAASTPPPASSATAFHGRYAREIVLTATLAKPFNRNAASALRYVETAIESGDATAKGGAGQLAKNTRVDSIHIPTHLAAVRMSVSVDSARGIFGQALGTARSTAGVHLADSRGQTHQPVAWVLVKGDEQQIHVDLNQPIQSANQLPLTNMTPGSELYLYFAVPRPATLSTVRIGSESETIEPALELR